MRMINSLPEEEDEPNAFGVWRIFGYTQVMERLCRVKFEIPDSFHFGVLVHNLDDPEIVKCLLHLAIMDDLL